MGSGTDGACAFCGSQRHYARDHARCIPIVIKCTHDGGHIFEDNREKCTWCGLYWRCIEKGHSFMGKPSLCSQCKMEKPMETKPEKVDHPAHYGGADDPYEPIKVIRAWNLNFALGSAVKYIYRAGKKLGETVLDDLSKARWYVDDEVKDQGGKSALCKHKRMKFTAATTATQASGTNLTCGVQARCEDCDAVWSGDLIVGYTGER